MRRPILLAAIAVVAISAGTASAKTTTVTITKNGYVPSSTAIAQGDVVHVTNSDTVSGVLSTQKVGENIDVLAQQCDASAATKLVAVPTTAGGAYTTLVKPPKNTAYTAKDKALSSATVTVRVRPSLRLVEVAAHRYTLRVSAGSSLAGKYASFQRFTGTHWVAFRTVVLKSSTAVVSTASFRSTIRAGLRIRATLPQVQVGSCFAAGTSNTILS